MFEILGKIVLAGVGLANVTKEKAEKVVDALIKKDRYRQRIKKLSLTVYCRVRKKWIKILRKK